MVKELAVTLADRPKYVVISSKTSKGNTYLTKLLSAVNIAKAQPRRTTRTKYKEEAGYRPVMNAQVIQDPKDRIIFFENDLFIFKNADGTNSVLIIVENISQNDFILHKAVVGKLVEECHDHADCFQLIDLEEKYVSVEEDALLTDRTSGCPSYSVDVCYRVSSSCMHDFYNLVNV